MLVNTIPEDGADAGSCFSSSGFSFSLFSGAASADLYVFVKRMGSVDVLYGPICVNGRESTRYGDDRVITNACLGDAMK